MSKNFIKAILVILATIGNIAACKAAADCEMFIQVSVQNPGDAPDELGQLMTDRLITALNSTNLRADQNYGQLLLTGKFTDMYKQDGAGSPPQVAVHTTLTLSIGDVAGGSVFASKSFDLRGVGSSEQRAYINALKSLSARNTAFIDFVESGIDKTVEYFDNNYKAILAKAERAASMRDYEQALYYTTFIPACSKGYNAAQAATLKYFDKYIDYSGELLLRQAKAEFSKSPDAQGAEKAYALLAQIDPASSFATQANRLADEIKTRTKAEYDFHVHKKYEDKVVAERQRVNAAREIGVAFGRGQKGSTTNILWH